MLKVGITGGIGSGKSVICRVFATLGISVFDADRAAKIVMEQQPNVVTAIEQLLGKEAYEAGKLNKDHIARLVYDNKEMLTRLNAIVHPATTQYAADWMSRQQGHYLIKEAALFYESGTYTSMDVMIGVYAPKELRIKRATQRSNASRERIERIMAQQMDEEEKMSRCNYVITNDDVQAVLPQVLQLHAQLLLRAQV
jgi:dephospho-CoA kinase